MRESRVEENIVKQTRALGGVCWKWVSPGRRGVPDRICIFPRGVIVFVELKRPDLKDGRSETQKKVFRILAKLGCNVWLINDVAEFHRRLTELGVIREEVIS